MNSKKSPATKLQQFLDEINSVSKRYQYQLTPILSFTKQGIIPILEVVDVPPEKKLDNK